MAGKKKKIDPEQVRKLAKIGCTQQEMADILGCHPDTLRDRFSTEIARARADGNMSLRRAQFKRAVTDRSDSMLIHLGKHRLGQTDVKPDLDINAALDDALDEPKPSAKAGGDPPQVPE